MCSVNPLIIPRNYKVEEALDAASTNGDLVPMYNLLEVLKKPYDNRQEIIAYQSPLLLVKKYTKHFVEHNF